MVKCKDCSKDSLDAKGWYAELTPDAKVMRCPECGKKEEDNRYKMRFGDHARPNMEDLSISERIQHAKDLRKGGLSPWTYKKDQRCAFCENPESILTKETACTGCAKLE